MVDERDIEHVKPDPDADEERPVVEGGDDESPAVDSEAPEADALEQRRAARPEGGRSTPDLDREADPADVMEQSEGVPGGDEDEWD